MRSDARPSSSPLLSLLNVAGLCGWASVLLLLALHPTPTPTLLRITLGCELLCTLEVSLIAIGVLCEPAEEEWGANAGVVCVRTRGGWGGSSIAHRRRFRSPRHRRSSLCAPA